MGGSPATRQSARRRYRFFAAGFFAVAPFAGAFFMPQAIVAS